ncbi:MarR family winged helix-turn-helix transcriptional regulator [Lutimaribacter marinistellae]|uniref:MarR family winged helix-turn-helix transcriptional regulator n=1 Tax=Lutimaribacter marinistellae TaxID=1820329 RepID=A0ABV7TNR4_9RHOB
MTSIHQSLGYWVSLISRSMEAEFSRRLAPHGLTRMSYAVLGAMVFDKQSTPSDVADFLGLDRGAASRLLDKLEVQGLIRRDRDRSDRRSVSIRVTSRGETLAHEMQVQSRVVNDMFTAALTPDQAAEFIEMAKAMVARSEARPNSL